LNVLNNIPARVVCVKLKEKELRNTIEQAVREQRIITFVTYMLSGYGEETLRAILSGILEHYGRTDLSDIAYMSAKELVLNATKANLKRVLFKQLQLDMNDSDDYEMGMKYFKTYLTDDSIRNYKSRFHENSLPVTTTFYYNPNVLNIKVKNNFLLEPLEEKRIRDRFQQATSFSSLFDFYAEYGEMAVSTGPEITMVGMLFDRSGIDRHAFTLYSSKKYNETIAKLEIPLVEYYVPKRKKFLLEMEELGINADELRKEFHYTYRDFKRE
jgi:hypothetical protein